MSLISRLKAIIENPEDLSDLPRIIEEVTTLETEYNTSLDKIGKLHELNRKYLSMIPINDSIEEPKVEEPEPPSVEDAVQEIINQLK